MLASSDLALARRGTVRVAALPSVSARLLPVAMVRFKKSHPGIVVRVRDVVGEDIVALVKAEEVDFGVGIRLTPDRDIKVEDFVSDSICAFFPNGHPLETGPSILTMADCVAYPLILTGRNSSVRVLFERSMAREGVEVQVAAEANYMSTALGMVRAGLGVAVLPASAVDSGNAIGLGFKVIDAPWLSRRVGIVRKSGRSLPPVAELFIDALHEVAAGRPDANFTSARRPETRRG
nr:LysR substrate-binding domain-containing protein [Rhodospirillum rubrum]